MAKLNLGQDVANKTERKQTAAYMVAKFDPLQLAVTVLFLKSIPLVVSKYLYFLLPLFSQQGETFSNFAMFILVMHQPRYIYVCVVWSHYLQPISHVYYYYILYVARGFCANKINNQLQVKRPNIADRALKGKEGKIFTWPVGKSDNNSTVYLPGLTHQASQIGDDNFIIQCPSIRKTKFMLNCYEQSLVGN